MPQPLSFDTQGLLDSKKATIVLITLATIVILFVVGMLFHAEVASIIEKVSDIIMFYLTGQTGVDALHKIYVEPKQTDALAAQAAAAPNLAAPAASDEVTDRYANR